MTKNSNEPTLQKFHTIPDFLLPSTDGKMTSPHMYRMKQNLLLVFVHYYQCAFCYPLLSDLKKNYSEIQRLNTEVLLIVSGDERLIKNLQHHWMLPFPILSDADEHVTKQYLNVNIQHRPALMLIDRYGVVWKYYITGIDMMEFKLQHILQWLEFIEIQCPECGISDEPENDIHIPMDHMIKI